MESSYAFLHKGIVMIIDAAPKLCLDPDVRYDACAEAAELALERLILEAEAQGWQPAEMAMAIADAAEDYILSLAQRSASRH